MAYTTDTHQNLINWISEQRSAVRSEMKQLRDHIESLQEQLAEAQIDLSHIPDEDDMANLSHQALAARCEDAQKHLEPVPDDFLFDTDTLPGSRWMTPAGVEIEIIKIEADGNLAGRISGANFEAIVITKWADFMGYTAIAPTSVVL